MPQHTDLQTFFAIMRWKLGWGSMNDLLAPQPATPAKPATPATRESWNVEDMPQDHVSHHLTLISITVDDLNTLRLGHIPAAQEDHWFMYCDEDHLRIYRSWTGMCAYEAHFSVRDTNLVTFDSITVNHALAEFGVNSEAASLHLFRYLITAAAGHHAEAEQVWEEFIMEWTDNNDRCNRYNEDGTPLSPREQWERNREIFEEDDKEEEEETDEDEEEENEEEEDEDDSEPNTELAPTPPPAFLRTCRVAGLKYHAADMVWDELREGTRVVLVRDEDNQYDRYAVAVVYTKGYDTELHEHDDYILGYLPRSDNRLFAVLLDMGWGSMFQCEISQICPNAHPEQRLQIDIYVRRNEGQRPAGLSDLRVALINHDTWLRQRKRLQERGAMLMLWTACLPVDDLPQRGEKVVLVCREPNATIIYHTIVAARGDEATRQLTLMERKRAEHEHATPFLLHNIAGPVVVPRSALDFLDSEDIGEMPRTPVSAEAAGRLEYLIYGEADALTGSEQPAPKD